MTCIGNSGELMSPAIDDAIKQGDIVSSAVLSGNRNFEGRVHPLTRANYLASPPLVVAYALAGRCDIDFEKEPVGKDADGNPVFLKDIWPSREEISEVRTQPQPHCNAHCNHNPNPRSKRGVSSRRCSPRSTPL